MLLSRDFSTLKTTATTALGFLNEHFEFEYLTSRISFLQGLLNWLTAVALEHTIPREDEGRTAIKSFVAAALVTLVLLLLSFYNAHMTFFGNYFQMCLRWFKVTMMRYILHWPPRPLAFLYIPSTVASIVLGIRAMIPEKEDYSMGQTK